MSAYERQDKESRQHLVLSPLLLIAQQLEAREEGEHLFIGYQFEEILPGLEVGQSPETLVFDVTYQRPQDPPFKFKLSIPDDSKIRIGQASMAFLKAQQKQGFNVLRVESCWPSEPESIFRSEDKVLTITTTDNQVFYIIPGRIEKAVFVWQYFPGPNLRGKMFYYTHEDLDSLHLSANFNLNDRLVVDKV